MSDFRDPLLERNPFAFNSYRDYVKEQRRNNDIQIAKYRNVAIMAVVALLVINCMCTLFLSGLYTVDEEGYFINRPGKVELHNNDQDVVSAADAQAAPSVNSAYGRVVKAEGDYAWLVNKFITYERGVMSADEVVMSFTGDCTIGTWPESSNLTNYNAVFEKAGSPTYSFDNMKYFFANDDYTYINLETTLTASTKRYKEKTYNFKGDPGWAQTMIKNSFVDGCDLANNHSFDYEQEGYDETIQVVEAAGMDIGDQDTVITLDLNGLEVVILSCNYIYEKVQLPQYLWGDELTAHVKEQIKQYKRPDNIVIVCCHWGLERQQTPDYSQFNPGREFIDEGADLIIGNHPHTIQSVEYYNGKFIFYSLGNFAFGGKATTDEVNRISLVVRPRFALRDGVAQLTGVLIVPCYTTSAEDIRENDYKPRPLYGEEARKLMEQVKSFAAYMRYGTDSLEFPTANFEKE